MSNFCPYYIPFQYLQHLHTIPLFLLQAARYSFWMLIAAFEYVFGVFYRNEQWKPESKAVKSSKHWWNIDILAFTG